MSEEERRGGRGRRSKVLGLGCVGKGWALQGTCEERAGCTRRGGAALYMILRRGYGLRSEFSWCRGGEVRGFASWVRWVMGLVCGVEEEEEEVRAYGVAVLGSGR